MQGMELGLQTLAAGGASMVGTLQGGKGETTRFEPARDDARTMTDKPAFENFLSGVRKQGARFACCVHVAVRIFAGHLSAIWERPFPRVSVEGVFPQNVYHGRQTCACCPLLHLPTVRWDTVLR